MPAHNAHYLFGRTVLEKLPTEIQKIINISAIISGGLNLIQIPFVTIPVITAVQLNMLYQINRKYNVETRIKMLIGNVIATVGILLFLQTISPQLTNLIYFLSIFL